MQSVEELLHLHQLMPSCFLLIVFSVKYSTNSFIDYMHKLSEIIIHRHEFITMMGGETIKDMFGRTMNLPNKPLNFWTKPL